MNTTSATPHGHYKSVENIDIVNKKSQTVDSYSIPKTAVKDATDDNIQTKPVISPHTTNMLYMNITVDDDSQSFATPRKHNHSSTAPSAQFFL